MFFFIIIYELQTINRLRVCDVNYHRERMHKTLLLLAKERLDNDWEYRLLPLAAVECKRILQQSIHGFVVFEIVVFKACVYYFLSKIYISQNDNPSKTLKNVFYFIQKVLSVVKIFKFLYFHLPLFFLLSVIASEIDRR